MVATTIAETSVTIDGVGYVIDACLVKMPFFNPLTGEESLLVVPESKAAAQQRAGRAGRVMPGKCYRLLTEKTFKETLPQSTIPDIQRTNLVWVVLQLRALGIYNLLNFEFLSPPPVEAIVRAFEVLYALGAIDNQGHLIEPIGNHMAEFPVEPCLAKMLLASFNFGYVSL